MPVRNPVQINSEFTVPSTRVDAVKGTLGVRGSVALKYSGSAWTVNYHDGNGFQAYAGATFDPPFQVRAVNLVDESELFRWIKFDSAGIGEEAVGGTGQRELLSVNVRHASYITRVYLDANTTATEIHLHG